MKNKSGMIALLVTVLSGVLVIVVLYNGLPESEIIPPQIPMHPSPESSMPNSGGMGSTTKHRVENEDGTYSYSYQDDNVLIIYPPAL